MAQKRKTEFTLPYFGIEETGKYPTIYNLKGDYGVIFQLNNPVLQYSADPSAYDTSHQLYVNIIKILGEGYVIQKQDILTKKIYNKSDSTEYLQKKYDEHFNGREYTDLTTFLVVTRKAKRGTFFTYNNKHFKDFEQNIGKLEDLLKRNNLLPKILSGNEIDLYVKRILSMNFSTNHVSLNNLLATDVEIKMGDRAVRSVPLIDIDKIDLPEKISTHVERNDKDSLKGFPLDTMGFLYNVPGYQTIIYNQVIDIPAQNFTQRKLELKRKRHSGIPDPANNMCVEDIDDLMVDIARENQMLVYCHFNFLVCAPLETIQQTCNYIESSLFEQLGIIPNKNAYNQMELFRTAMPCNTVELDEYDLFLTTADAALCFFFKEALSKDELSGFQIRFTDRQGIPVAIDPADLPMQTNRINNRNKFVLGPSGSGKSFFMNALIEQYCMYNKSPNPKWQMDVVIVDTGHSYSGLCSYYGGKYITYSEDKPITMNPFAISEGEYNIEKKDFLKTLISLLWKGAEGTVNQVESDVIAQCISAYYSNFFGKPLFIDLTDEQINQIQFEAEREAAEIDFTEQAKAALDLNAIEQEAKGIAANFQGSDDEKISFYEREYERIYNHLIGNEILCLREAETEELYYQLLSAARQEAKEDFKRKNVVELSFNSFYEYALYKIPEIKQQERIPFDIDEFRFVLKKFYKGGEFEAILNEEADNSLFTEPFVVFEIDSIKGAHVMAA